jgi:Rrf2 family cysteine metabolism transcriptional repressor
MFSVTTKGLYGAQALIEMAVRKDEGVLQLKDLSEKCGIPKNYLEQLFNLLRKAGVVSSLRGNKGGYVLAKEASEISLLEILEALEGPVEISKNIEFGGALRKVFNETEETIKNCFSVSLADLAEQEVQLKENVTFYI